MRWPAAAPTDASLGAWDCAFFAYSSAVLGWFGTQRTAGRSTEIRACGIDPHGGSEQLHRIEHFAADLDIARTLEQLGRVVLRRLRLLVGRDGRWSPLARARLARQLRICAAHRLEHDVPSADAKLPSRLP